MKETQGQEASYSEARGDEFSLLDLVLALAKRKRYLIGVPLLSAVLAGAISLATPSVYLASTTMMPPQQQQSGASALLSQLGGVAGIVAGGAGVKSPNELYVGMLKSNTIADKLIAKFNLKQAYETDSQENARKALSSKTSITSGKDGLITISVEDTDKKLVASIANAYVTELVDLTKVLAVTDAAKRRMFYEREFEKAKNNLASAEAALRNSLDTHGVISVDAESRSIVETVGRLRAQVSAKEIQLNSMSAFVTSNNPDYKIAQQELESLKAQLSKLENGRGKVELGEQKSNSNPAAGLENIKQLRDVKYYQMLYELLGKQYEIARIDEAKDPAIIQVLDPAVEPERKHAPKPTVMVIIVFVLSLIMTMAWAIVKEGIFSGVFNQQDAAKWMRIKDYLRKI